MNSILNNGVVTPIIHFQFADGNYIDTYPTPRYFLSFSQKRSVKKACSFSLTLTYPPGNFGESEAILMHQLLLSNANQRVLYRYGYSVPGGSPKWQNQEYVGIFTKYLETINDGYLQYTITGIAQAIECTSPEAKIHDYISNLIEQQGKKQPSAILKDMVSGNGFEDDTIKNFFTNYNTQIDESDEQIDVKSFQSVPQQNCTIHDVIFGKNNTDGSSYVGGIVNYGIKSISAGEAYQSGIISASQYNAWQTLVNHGLSGQAAAFAPPKQRFMSFFDNVSTGGKAGTFYYVPETGNQTGSIFTYNFGNDFIDSDVLGFHVDADWTAALGNAGSLGNTRSSIDAGGQNVGSTLSTTKLPTFNTNIYNTPSGFDTNAFLTSSTLSTLFNFPINATMEVLGQTDCNKLMDRVQVNIHVNGMPHPALTGMYVITDIEDNLSESGFTTSFTMFKLTETSNSTMSSYYSVHGKAVENQNATQYDYSS